MINTKVEGGHLKKVLSLAILGVLAVLIACANVQGTNKVPRVTKDELKVKLGSSGMVLLHVRAMNDWKMSNEKLLAPYEWTHKLLMPGRHIAKRQGYNPLLRLTQ